MSVPGWFVTGTDTGVGKTVIAAALLVLLRRAGFRPGAMKPIATGCRETPGGLVCEDAEQLAAACGERVPYADLNPYAFAPPIAPHLAAAEAGRVIEVEVIRRSFARLAAGGRPVVVEGVGGWRVPVQGRISLAELALALRLPVVMVVGIRLGCLNHALLTAETILADGAPLAGWVANQIEPDEPRFAALVEALRERIDAPLLGAVPWLERPSAERVADLVRLPAI